MSIIRYDEMFLYVSILFLLILLMWAAYEICGLLNDDEDVLPPPRPDRIAKGGKDAWIVGNARTTKEPQ